MHTRCTQERSSVWTRRYARRTVVSTDSYWSLPPTIGNAFTASVALPSTVSPPRDTRRMSYANQVQIPNDDTHNLSCRLCNTGVFSRSSSLKHFLCPVGVPRPRLIYPQIFSVSTAIKCFEGECTRNRRDCHTCEGQACLRNTRFESDSSGAMIVLTCLPAGIHTPGLPRSGCTYVAAVDGRSCVCADADYCNRAPRRPTTQHNFLVILVLTLLLFIFKVN